MSSSSDNVLKPLEGSFRDPSGRVYCINGRIFRGVNNKTANNFRQLKETKFYQRALKNKTIVPTWFADNSDLQVQKILSDGWDNVLEHEKLPLISYPYEWTFSMLKDAALLQLGFLEEAFEEGWTLKDATPYNIQFTGSHPVFIDIPSFVPRSSGDTWIGYRQFCMLNLFPLMLTSYLKIPFQPVLRSYLDGIDPITMRKYFRGLRIFRKGILSHVVFPAFLEKQVERTEKDKAPAKKRENKSQSDLIVKSLISSMKKLVQGLSHNVIHTEWSEYSVNHSYDKNDYSEKETFIRDAVQHSKPNISWDIGGNTGHFSKILADSSHYVLTIDGDHDAVEKLYREQKKVESSKILPLVMNLANISPNQGWMGKERLALDQRNNPDFVIVLALIHHMGLSANIPLGDFLEWLKGLAPKLVIEFVDRDDEMVIKLLTNKTEKFSNYNKETFIKELEKRFTIISQKDLKEGCRSLYFCQVK